MSNRQPVGLRDLLWLLLTGLFTLLGLSGRGSGREDGSKSSTSPSSGVEALQPNTLAAVFLCVAFLFLPGRSWAQAGLVAAYGFNEGVGTTLTDLSGNGNTGTIGGARLATAGQVRHTAP